MQAAPVPGGRYEIHGIVVDEPTANSLHEVYLIDTETGRVWQRQSGAAYKNPDGSSGFIPPSFQPIQIAPGDGK